MKTELCRIFSMKKFLNILELTDQNIRYNFKKPSILLMNNIYYRWLQTISFKKSRAMTVYSSKENYENALLPRLPFGFLDNKIINYDESTVVEHQSNVMAPKKTGQLSINIFVPRTDSNQYFIQWQRYRKYWWSSISTTPSLFASEINYENGSADANITASFKWGQLTVETITMNCKDSNQSTSCITCSTSLEKALFTLLLDGLNYSTKGDHFRLHRSMAPYKISFVINFEGVVDKQRLCELAELMYYRLIKNNVSSFLPNFELTMEQQIIENLRLGIAYTVILCETTLTNGIFHLLNSNTMLREQVHLADFDSYAKMLCK